MVPQASDKFSHSLVGAAHETPDISEDVRSRLALALDVDDLVEAGRLSAGCHLGFCCQSRT